MKSHVSDLLDVAIAIYSDGVAKCTGVTLDKRDIDTLMSRVEHEGLSFLTITLPTFGKDFDLSLSSGRIDPTSFRAFKKLHGGRIPAFLQGIFGLVFDETGRICNEASIPAIETIRQIAYSFKKLEMPCTPIRVAQAVEAYVAAEQCFEEALDPGDIQYFLEVSHCLWSGIFGGEDNSLLLNAIPGHGPGATAERLSGNAKYLGKRWHDRLEPYFPLLDNAFVNSNARSSEGFKKVSVILESDEQPVRVIAVPKTLKTPRIIAIEPVCMQYTQQGLSKAIVKCLEGNDQTAGHLNFSDQSINRRLALMSSKNERFATLDLSSASDLVPYQLAIRMFDSDPDLKDAISACRSTKAQLPQGPNMGPLGGKVIPLRKFASMGSALCFPVEAMYFYTICVAALLKKRNLPVTSPNLSKVGKDVYVYGDDIIVLTRESDVVIHTLHKYYCKVNVRKSFFRGRFRESCGMDAFGGDEVTPTYIRQLPPNDKRNAQALVSWLSASNHLYLRGYWRASSLLLKRVELILGTLPIVGQKCEGLGKTSFQRHRSVERWGRRYHRPEVKTWVIRPVYRSDCVNGYSALLKCLLKLETFSPSEDVRDFDRYCGFRKPTGVDNLHLNRSVQRGAVTLKRRWLTPF